MKNEELSISVISSKGIPKEFEEQIFNIEKNTFGHVYEKCPTDIKQFRERYAKKELYIVMCVNQAEIAGFRIFNKISQSHVNSMFMVVKESYRNRKISNILCSISYQYFKWLGYKYISSWTRIDITASKILAKYAPYISTKPNLNNIELSLLNEFEKYYNLEAGYYGNRRRVSSYYKMICKNSGDAYFWVHNL